MDLPPRQRLFHRWEVPASVRFLTFSCFRRLPLLHHDGIKTVFVERLTEVCRAEQVRLLAWVVMPEHVHLLVYPIGEPNMTHFTHSLKRPVAERVLRRWKDLDAPILGRVKSGQGHRFWQTGGGYDRNLVDRDAVVDKISYIHGNPVRRKLVAVPTDYLWSSARWYEGLPDCPIACGPPPWEAG